MQQYTDDSLLSRQETADLLGVEKHTLEVWATTKRYNLPYIKVGRLVRYRMSDIRSFLESRKEGI